MLITSRQNPKIKDTAKLQLKKHRDAEQKFLVEGYYPILFALTNHYPVEELFVCPPFFRDKFDNQTLVSRLQENGATITELTKQLYEKISSYESPEGLIATAHQKHNNIKDQIPQKNDIYILIESIEKPTNLGAILRLADNAGATGVIICNMRTDIFNPQVIRSSVGCFFSTKIIESSTADAIDWCKINRITILATSPNAKNYYTTVDMTGAIAIVMGTEYAGLSNEWLKNADEKIKIPMFGQANSLSVTASTAIVLYEALRQRNNKKSFGVTDRN